ncbi:thermonuclease family protein, partial [Pedobacter sp. ASV28]|uniref:thermonuclease family protein n=1 Tax=Pedobacter sp. ASV28 TaxID=2795123 RepID=UPI00351C81E7
MRLGRLAILALCLGYCTVFAADNPLKILKNQMFLAKVIRILDGDTMEVLYKNTPLKIRLAHIDAPEKLSLIHISEPTRPA